jgi:hypothetical protein
MLDSGLPLATESSILKELIKPPSILRKVMHLATGDNTKYVEEIIDFFLLNFRQLNCKRKRKKKANNRFKFLFLVLVIHFHLVNYRTFHGVVWMLDIPIMKLILI